MLSVEKLEAGYDTARVLFGVDLKVEAAEVVTLLGRNGMGKTTLVKAIMELLRPNSGTVSFEGHALKILLPSRTGVPKAWTGEQHRARVEFVVGGGIAGRARPDQLIWHAIEVEIGGGTAAHWN